MDRLLILIISTLLLTSCKSTSPNTLPRDSNTTSNSASRLITLDDTEMPPQIMKDSKFWLCKGKRYLDEGAIVEVGTFRPIDELVIDGVDISGNLGFVLYDGGNIGTFAVYRRTGLNHRWDFDDEYAFVIQPDGSGLYYDFSTVGADESTSPRQHYNCKRRK